MATHGVLTIKAGDTVWGFHLTQDGSNIMLLHEKFKHLNDPEAILKAVFETFVGWEYGDGGYTDCPCTNIYKERFNPEKDYQHITTYTCHFDGSKWVNNWNDKK
jgi:hypothetical protein